MDSFPIHTEAYWRDQFDISPEEEVELQEMFLQVGRPLSSRELATHLMRRQLTPAGRRRAGDQRYHPSLHYEVGDEIAVPALDDAPGTVRSVRPGENPRYDPFTVIEVEVEGQAQPALLASDFSNLEGRFPDRDSSTGQQIDPDLLIEQYRDHVVHQLEQVLEGENFLRLADQWMPRLMLVGLHEGHANLAEAMIEVVGEPLSATELLPEMPIEEDAGDELLRFSLDYLLSTDSRFLSVEPNGTRRWTLKRLS